MGDIVKWMSCKYGYDSDSCVCLFLCVEWIFYIV